MFNNSPFEAALIAGSPTFLMRASDESAIDITPVPIASLALSKYVGVSGLSLVPSEGVFGRNSMRFTGNTDKAYVTCILPTSAKLAKPTFVFVLSRIRNNPGTTGNPGTFTDAFSCRINSSGFIFYLSSSGSIAFQLAIGGTLRVVTCDNVDISEHGSIVHVTFDGRYYSISVDGTVKGTFDNGSITSVTYPSSYKILFGCATDNSGNPTSSDQNFADFDFQYFGIYNSLSSVDIAAQVAAFSASKAVSGTAILDDGQAAASVVISEWAGNRKAVVTPTETGAWNASVPPGDYLITGVGPSGYRPISHGPVTAVTP